MVKEMSVLPESTLAPRLVLGSSTKLILKVRGFATILSIWAIAASIEASIVDALGALDMAMEPGKSVVSAVVKSGVRVRAACATAEASAAREKTARGLSMGNKG